MRVVGVVMIMIAVLLVKHVVEVEVRHNGTSGCRSG